MKKPFFRMGRDLHGTTGFCSGTGGGFTLVEILITTVLVFLLFTLIYATFFSISTVTAELQGRMKSAETIFRFLNRFDEEIKCMICEKGDEDTVFNRDELTFITKDTAAPYPVRITYSVETTADDKKTLLRKQENLLDGYSFVFPALKDADSIDFLFYDGENWDYAVEKEKVTAVAVEADCAGEKIFFPVKIYRDKADDKEEEKK